MKGIYKAPIRDGVKGTTLGPKTKQGYILLRSFIRISNKTVSRENIISFSRSRTGPLCRFFLPLLRFWILFS